ncbi:MAG: hypothetical protein ACR2Q4_24250, partial [Geminicoccaceae bacterium]
IEYRTKVCGKIRDYVFVDETKSGHLAVELVQEEYCTRQAFLDCKPDRVTTYHWDIEVPEYCYEVHERDDNGFPNNPFPTLPDVSFPPHALDPDDARSIWCRCLDYKLYAKGSKIRILNVYKSVDGGDLIRLDESKPENAGYYQSTESSCVDIMFKGYPPATQLPPQIEYCLGRCVHPPVVNSGGM